MQRRKIIRLDPNTVKRIAAGEVVNRPANVVKELVENSLDAGASKIAVTIKNGGKSLIEVVDNGTGIPPDEVELAFELHTTNKIYSPDDLNHLISYGFRGEALASIASVSIVEIWTTYEGNEKGVYLLLEGGKVKEKKEILRKPGTTIRVRDLFYNTPARRKFMKSDTTEKTHIVNTLTGIALARPDVHLSLSDGTRNIINAPKRKSLQQRIFDIFGPQIAKYFLELEPSDIFTGFITDPEFKAKDRSLQHFIVNKRPVHSPLLANALKTGYGNLLMSRQYPGAVIHVEIDPEKVDVNIHPSKLEIRFKNEEEIFEELKKLVETTLKSKIKTRIVENQELVKNKKRTVEFTDALSLYSEKNSFAQSSSFAHKETPHIVSEHKHEQVENEIFPKQKRKSPMVIDLQQLIGDKETVVAPKIHESLPDDLILKTQIMKKYFVAETKNELVLIDMHAAHERVNYEKNLKILENKQHIQTLLEPIVIKLPATHLTNMVNKKEEMEEIGFRYFVTGDKIHITALPGIFPPKITPKEIIEILLDILGNDFEKTADREMFSSTSEYLRHILAAKTACYYSLRAGDEPGLKKFAEILAELRNCEKPLVCAHGRPVLVRFPEQWLDRKFRRIV